MFSKKVEDHDDTKQELALTMKDLNTMHLSNKNLTDFEAKY